MHAQQSYEWRFFAAAPPREIFAVMEQMTGVAPYRYEVLDANSAQSIEAMRKSFFGGWTKKIRRRRWIKCTAIENDTGTNVVVEVSRGKAPRSRGLQLVRLFTQGNSDRRTIYRSRVLPKGPVTLVASWAGMEYPLYLAPHEGAPRGTPVHTATPMESLGVAGMFCHVRLADGTEGYIERDQLVPAPEDALREAQAEVARFG